MRRWARTLLALIALAVAGLAISRGLGAAFGSDRTIALYNIHTTESISVEYKKAGKYVPEALKQINWIMRDWRRDETTQMDPALVDLLWELHTELGSKEPIHIISAFRSRATNDLLRKTVGGQASESRHILGKAADVHFPDVSLRQIRYSALIRERGGVGYYPTSAIPFVHIDTDAVRHWPRMPRYELALLFPNGSTRHQPADGGPIGKDDVRIARASHKELVTQVAEYFDVRAGAVAARTTAPGIAVASAGAGPGMASPTGSRRVALSPARSSEPRLVAEPKLVERPSRFMLPSSDDRERLAHLVAMAQLPQLVREPRPVGRGKRAGFEEIGQVLAALDAGHAATTVIDAWASAPAYDEEHPDELSYRPFPVAPLLTLSASADDPVLTTMVRPEVSRTLDLLDQPGGVLPMRLRPGLAIAEQMSAGDTQAFRGDAVKSKPFPADTSGGVADRRVRTSGQ